MNKKLLKPYQFKKSEIETIQNNFVDDKDWDKNCFNELKINIVKHLRSEQSNKCCYCKRELGFDIKAVDIEHILPKSKYKNFTFEPLNLALSCPGCNTKKSSTDISLHSYKRYPKNSNKIKIVHPHFDKYFDEIKIIDGTIYAALTKKGSETITICELFRIKEVIDNAKISMANGSKEKKLIEDIRTSEVDTNHDLIEDLEALIQRHKK